MTRREQTLRAWITRKNPALPWRSCVSFKGRTHIITTETRLRKAAREFNLLHISRILSSTLTAPTTDPHHQPELFS